MADTLKESLPVTHDAVRRRMGTIFIESEFNRGQVMEPKCSKLTERILDLTLEIIYLLTGEDEIVAKKASGDGQNPIMVPLCSSLFSRRNNDQKILEVTQKMIELLTGEVPHPHCPALEGLNVNEIKVEYTSEEGKESVKGGWSCKEEEEIQLEREADGSRDPPQRCPHRLDSQDSTQEGHTVPHNDQRESWNNCNNTIKEEIKEDEVPKDLYKDVMMEDQPALPSPDGSRNTPQRCPRPLDSIQDPPTISHQDQGEDVKIEVKEEEETYVRDDQLSVKDETMVTVTKEESVLHISSGGHGAWNTSKGNLIVPTAYDKEDNGMAQYSPGVRLGTQYIHQRLDPSNSEESNDVSQPLVPDMEPSCHSAGGSPDPSIPEDPPSIHLDAATKRDDELCPPDSVYNGRNHKVEFPFRCSECGKGFKMKRALHIHQLSHTGKKIYSCPDCEKLYITNCGLVAHKKLHAGEKPYTCFKCEASFGLRSQLTAHQKVHYVQKPFSCSECEKSFMTKQELVHHQRTHTGEKPFSCSECGRSFARTSQLKRHYRVHTGEKPFSCSECHKCFSTKMIRDNHMRVHTGERPYSCLQCGRCFTQKGALTVHQKKHTTRDC